MSNLNSLPMKIVMEILARLPVKTIGRCRCVCRSWHSSIAKPFFINKHLLHICSTIDTSSSSVIIQSGPGKFKMSGQSLWHWETLVEPKSVEFPKVNHNYARVVGSSNGLLCLVYYQPKVSVFGAEIILWNPSIQRFKILPKSSFPKLHHVCPRQKLLGFGFDPRTNDYKVVQIVYKNIIFPTIVDGVEVYTLSTDSWRTKSTSDNIILQNKLILDFYSPNASFKGYVHWKAYMNNEESNKVDQLVIVSFHMVDEIFREINVPALITGSCKVISAFRDSLALFVRDFPHYGDWDIWLMKDYGVVDSWTKQYTLSNSVGYPFEFMDNGEVLIRSYDNDLDYYDPKTQKFENLNVQLYVNCKVIYKESLALLNDGIDCHSK